MGTGWLQHCAAGCLPDLWGVVGVLSLGLEEDLPLTLERVLSLDCSSCCTDTVGAAAVSLACAGAACLVGLKVRPERPSLALKARLCGAAGDGVVSGEEPQPPCFLHRLFDLCQAI